MAIGITEKEYKCKLSLDNPNIDHSGIVYVNNRTRIRVSCKSCGHAWTPKAGMLIGVGKTGCPKCSLANRPSRKRITAEEWWKRSCDKHNNKYTCDITKYVDQNTPIDIVCPKHGNFSMSPVRHMHRSGCPECGKYSGNPKVTTESFIKRIKELYGDQYTTDNVTYVSQHELVSLTCKNHGVFNITPKALLRGTGCSKCLAHKSSRDKEGFVRRAKAIHGDRYDYTNTVYVNTSESVNILCREHGEFTQRAGTHLEGHGCYTCGSRGKRVSYDEFVARVRVTHPELLIDKTSGYTHSGGKVRVKCKEHGYVTVNAADVLRKPNPKRGPTGCPVCVSSSGERRVYSLLSYLKLDITRQHRFKNSAYRYDFYLPYLNILIEYDGYQHYYPIEFWGGEEALLAVKKHDKLKTELAKTNNVELVRIPYTKDNELESYLLWLLSKYNKYYHNGTFYKTFIEFANQARLPSDATVGNYDKYKTINIKLPECPV